MSFTPFNDSPTPEILPEPTRDGYDTSAWDVYRQGVEITNDKFRFLGNQPKFWSGTTDGQITIDVYGQYIGFVEDDTLGMGNIFLDNAKFDPIGYVTMSLHYPLPILFNDGPMQQTEASVEALTIPFKKKTNEGPYYVHDMHADLGDGNNFDDYVRPSANRIEQFIEIRQPISASFFLDEGRGYMGNVPLDTYTPGILRILSPYNDQSVESLITINNTVLTTSLHNGENILPIGKKSASAGWTYNYNKDGTDSIVFGNWMR